MAWFTTVSATNTLHSEPKMYYEYVIGVFIVRRLVTETSVSYVGIDASVRVSLTTSLLNADPNSIDAQWVNGEAGSGTITITSRTEGEWEQV